MGEEAGFSPDSMDGVAETTGTSDLGVLLGGEGGCPATVREAVGGQERADRPDPGEAGVETGRE